MKLCTRISSIRRIAWNACRSCSPASCSMCPDSLRSHADAGCTRSPCCREHAGHRVLREPVDLQVRAAARAARRRSRRRAARARGRWATRGRARAAAGSRRAVQRRLRRRAGASRSTNCAIRWLTCTGSRAGRAVPGALEQRPGRRRSARRAARRTPPGGSGRRCRAPRRTGQRTCRRERRRSARTPRPRTRAARRSCRRASAALISCAQPMQSSICLVECGSENILREEELDEVVVAAAEPVVLVVLRPALRCRRAARPTARGRGPGVGDVQAARRARSRRARHALGVLGGDVHRPGRPAGHR